MGMHGHAVLVHAYSLLGTVLNTAISSDRAAISIAMCQRDPVCGPNLNCELYDAQHNCVSVASYLQRKCAIANLINTRTDSGALTGKELAIYYEKWVVLT